MKIREAGSVLLVLGMILGWGFSEYTAQDFSELRDFAQNHAVEIKEKWVEERAKCMENGEFKENKLCQKIKDYDPEARELWNKLKEADNKAEVIEENLHRFETVREIVMDVSKAVGNV